MRVGRLHRSDQGLAGLSAVTFEPVDAAEPAVRFAVRSQLGGAAWMFAFGAVFVAVSAFSIVGDPSFASVAWSSLFLIVGLVVVVLAFVAAREGLRGRGELALARDGLLIVGRDLEEPIPVRDTTFDVQNVDGSLFVVLRHAANEQVLHADNWRATRGMTLREALPTLGLTPAHPEPRSRSTTTGEPSCCGPPGVRASLGTARWIGR